MNALGWNFKVYYIIVLNRSTVRIFNVLVFQEFDNFYANTQNKQTIYFVCAIAESHGWIFVVKCWDNYRSFIISIASETKTLEDYTMGIRDYNLSRNDAVRKILFKW